jgi:hypothetical protein
VSAFELGQRAPDLVEQAPLLAQSTHPGDCHFLLHSRSPAILGRHPCRWRAHDDAEEMLAERGHAEGRS